MTQRAMVLDTEAVSALTERDHPLIDLVAAARRRRMPSLIPSVVLAELMTGRRSDAELWHVVNRLRVARVDAQIAAQAGALRERAEAARRKKRDLTIDAIVASVAVDHAPAVVLTADPEDFRLLVASHDVVVEPISRGG